jgi:hypothetical protein|tara:strand:- start:821 stop:1114 length:294 start_codon:yes stop_codon:yes gene_type:complete
MTILVLQVAWDASYVTGGEPLDLTGYDITNCWGVVFGGNDTSADNAVEIRALTPTPTETLTASNLHLQAWVSSTGVEVASTTDESAIGQSTIIIFGR